AGLIGSIPSHNQRGSLLNQIPGMTPSLLSLPSGCAFEGRCPKATGDCKAQGPLMREAESGRKLRCFNPLIHVEASHD
ncbi:MAG: oligopeptide/dipeptide ABC transporter ATP-binding protein, partial [Deltaproteobacteria bacterium]